MIPTLDDAVMSGLVQEKGLVGLLDLRTGIVRAGLYDRLTRTTPASLRTTRVAAFIQSPGGAERRRHRPPGPPLPPCPPDRRRRGPTPRTTPQRSAEHAAAMLAWEDATLGFEHALDALDHERAPETRRRCDLLIALGNTRTEALQRHLARQSSWKPRRRRYRPADRDCLVQAPRGYTLFMTKQGDADHLADRDLGRHAHDPGSGRPRRTSNAVGPALSTAHRLCGDDDRMRSTSVAALELARTAADTTALRVVARGTKSAALWDSPDVVARIAPRRGAGTHSHPRSPTSTPNSTASHSSSSR